MVIGLIGTIVSIWEHCKVLIRGSGFPLYVAFSRSKRLYAYVLLHHCCEEPGKVSVCSLQKRRFRVGWELAGFIGLFDYRAYPEFCVREPREAHSLFCFPFPHPRG